MRAFGQFLALVVVLAVTIGHAPYAKEVGIDAALLQRFERQRIPVGDELQVHGGFRKPFLVLRLATVALDAPNITPDLLVVHLGKIDTKDIESIGVKRLVLAYVLETWKAFEAEHFSGKDFWKVSLDYSHILNEVDKSSRTDTVCTSSGNVFSKILHSQTDFVEVNDVFAVSSHYCADFVTKIREVWTLSKELLPQNFCLNFRYACLPISYHGLFDGSASQSSRLDIGSNSEDAENQGEQRHRVFQDAQQPVTNSDPGSRNEGLRLAGSLLGFGLLALFGGYRLACVASPRWVQLAGKVVIILACVTIAVGIEGFRQLG